jgi:uncharacterized protein
MPSVRISQFVLKVHSRCDLACDHCYVYEHRDHSWLRRPKVMAEATLAVAAARIADHARAHRIPSVRVILHGGEPLLVGPIGLRSLLVRLREAIDPATNLDLVMQTNGVQLNPELADLLVAHRVRVGVSFDGDVTATDRHRRFANGASSYGLVRAALALLRRPEYRPAYGGILCTIDINNDPVAVYEAVLAEQPPRIDFLLPHATHDHPPPRRGEYGRWLLRVHERWLADGRPIPVRLFDALGPDGPGSEAVGLHPADIVVIETDGEWEQADTLKTAYDGAPSTELNVFEHTVDDVAALPAVTRRQLGLAGLCAVCQACPVVHQCGGGLYAHRFRGGHFDHPSVYCDDLKELITGVNARTPAPQVRDPSAVDGGPDDSAPEGLIAELGTGYGSAATVGYLAETQLAFTKALLARIGQECPLTVAGVEGWQLLADLDRRALTHAAPATAAAMEAVLGHAYLRPWARAVLAGRAPTDGLAAVAASVAIRAGAEVDVPVQVIGGRLFLPTVGTIGVATGNPLDSVTGRLTVSADSIRLRLGEGRSEVVAGRAVTGRWWPAHRMTLPSVDALLEDQDPHRACHEWPVESALDPTVAAAWQDRAEGAWRVITAEGAGYLPGLSAGLRAVTPLIPDPARPLQSSTARDAFGAVAATPAGPDAFATMLVHEFQHSKLGALMDLYDLLDPRFAQHINVGWRPDPRPLEGVLQGTYAHLAVCDLWLARSHRDTPQAAAAGRHFRDYRDQTAAAIDALRNSAALTLSGAVFVDAMAATLADLV